MVFIYILNKVLAARYLAVEQQEQVQNGGQLSSLPCLLHELLL
jgi:hypothetical protein